MRKQSPIILIFALFMQPIMAATNHYVASDGTDTWANSTSSSTPCSLSTAFTNATAGDIVYIKAGTYSRSSASDAPTGDGTATTPILYIGCNSSWTACVSTRNGSGHGLLAGTDYPEIAYGSGYRLDTSGHDYAIWRCIKISGTYSGGLFRIGLSNVVESCIATNASTNSAAIGYELYGNYVVINNSDVALTGASGGSTAIKISSPGVVYGSVIYGSKNDGIEISSANSIVSNCLVYGVTDCGILISSASAAYKVNIFGNTIYGCTYGLYSSSSSTQITALSPVLSNAFIGCTTNISSAHANGLPLALCRNAYPTGVSTNGDWDEATKFDDVVDNSAVGSIFKDYANGDFMLVNSAAELGKGVLSSSIGCMQPGWSLPAITEVTEGNYVNGVQGTYHNPERSEVWIDVVFGQTTGTKRASSITNCSADNILSGVTIDDVSGNVTLPTAAQVLYGVVFGPNNNTTGTFDETTRNVDPGESNVKSGTSYKIQNSSKTGTYVGSGGGNKPASLGGGLQ